jgi:hypothetical protein
MSPLPLPLAFATAFYGIIYIGATLGQLSPIAIAAIALGALFVRTGKPIVASFCVGIALIQPQFAVPTVISCLLFVPRMRITLIAIFVLLCGVSLTLGMANILEYLKVLPLHARAELMWPGQYSLSWILSRAGLNDSVALGVGTLSSLLTLVIALIIVAKFRARAIASGAVVLLPAALAVCGGTFIHEYQIEVALLTSLILARKSQWGLDASIAAGLFLIPFSLTGNGETHWPRLSTLPTLIFSFVTAWATMYYLIDAQSARERVRVASTYTCVFLAYFLALFFTRPNFHLLYHINALPATQSLEFASENWRLTVLAQGGHVNGLLWILFLKLPTWFALLFTVTSAARTLAEGDETNLARGLPNGLVNRREETIRTMPI